MKIEEPKRYKSFWDWIDKEPLQAWVGFSALIVLFLLFQGISLMANRPETSEHETYSMMGQRHFQEAASRVERLPYETIIEMRRRHAQERDRVMIEQGCDWDAECIEQQLEAKENVRAIRRSIYRDDQTDRAAFLEELYDDAFSAGLGWTDNNATMNWLQTREVLVRGAASRGIVIFRECTPRYEDCYAGDFENMEVLQ